MNYLDRAKSGFFILVGTLLLVSCGEKAPGFLVTIDPEEYLRLPSPQIISIPDSLIMEGNPYLNDEEGMMLPLQQVNGDWVFIRDTIEANQTKTYTLIVVKEPSEELVKSTIIDGKLNVAVEGKPVLTYQMKTMLPPDGSAAYYQRGGFIHPAYAPNGEIVTDGFPVGHTHQHGIFFAWVKTTFKNQEIDFWNQHKENGTVVFDSLVSFSDGPVFSEFEGAQTAVVLNGEDTTRVLAERWKVRVYNLSQYYLWDIEVSQKNIAEEVLHIEPYHYGGMAFRGSADWNDTTATSDQELTGIGKGGFLTSEGLGRAGNHTRPNWVSMFGNVNNQPVFMAIMGHPKNYRAPSYVRIHPTMPYFCFTPVVEYGFDFKPGDVHVARYRVVSFSETADPGTIDLLWREFNQSHRSEDKPFL